MTLLDMLKRHGRLEISLLGTVGNRASAALSRGGLEMEVELEDVVFATGGALTLVHSTLSESSKTVA